MKTGPIHRPALLVSVIALALGILPSAPVAGEETTNQPPLYDIPQLEGVTIDGRADDWEGKGAFFVDLLRPVAGGLKTASDCDAGFQLGWNEKGLLLLVVARDNVFVENPKDDELWRDDAIETFLAPKRGAGDMCQWVIAPGLDPRQAELRWHHHDKRNDEALKSLPAELAAARCATNGGYVLEALLPWEGLAITPEIGREIAFQVWVNDSDAEGPDPYHAAWYPGLITSSDTFQMQRLRLARRAAGCLSALVETDYNMDRVQPRVSVLAPLKRVGNKAEVLDGNKTIASAKLAADESGRAVARIGLPIPPQGTRYEGLIVRLDGEQIGTASLPYSDRLASMAGLKSRQGELRERFGLDRPWDPMSEAAPLVRRHRGMMARAMRYLEPGHAPSDDEDWAILGGAADMLAALDAGEDYLGRQRNEFWSAYYSPADGSGQHFATVVPPDYDGSKAWPLVVWLHGHDQRPMPQRSVSHAGQEYILVWPWGRGDLGFDGLGENDVLSVMDYMKQWYNIDSNRVYLIGGSMGGGGTWKIASRHPDPFAGAAPICGYGNSLPLANLRHVPVFNQHGQADWVVSIDLSRYSISALQQMGYAAIHKEYPGAGHGIPNQYPAIEWLMKLRRPDRPDTITYTGQTPGKAYWLDIRRFAEPHEPASVQASVTGLGQHQGLTLDLRNVAALELDLAAMPVDRTADLLVQIGFTHLSSSAPLPERLFVLRKEGEWTLAGDFSPPPGPARPYVAGAAANLYRGEPLMIVYGTASATSRTALLRDAAVKLSRFGGGRISEEMALGQFPVKADRDVSTDDLSRFNLILIGSARDNALTAQMAGKLPLTIDTNNQLSAGGREPVSLDGAGLRLFCYNPLAPQRLIFLLATDEDDPAAQKWLAGAPELLTGAADADLVDQPDLMVQAVDGPRRRCMQFTHEWQWREVPGADRRAPESAATSRGMILAILRVMRKTAEADFALNTEGSDQVIGYDPRWFTAADMVAMARDRQILSASMTGEELAEIHQKWMGTNNLLRAVPAFEPTDVESGRVYRVAMSPYLCWDLKARQKNLTNVRAGPDWRFEDLLQELFSDDATRP